MRTTGVNLAQRSAKRVDKYRGVFPISSQLNDRSETTREVRVSAAVYSFMCIVQRAQTRPPSSDLRGPSERLRSPSVYVIVIPLLLREVCRSTRRGSSSNSEVQVNRQPPGCFLSRKESRKERFLGEVRAARVYAYVHLYTRACACRRLPFEKFSQHFPNEPATSHS